FPHLYEMWGTHSQIIRSLTFLSEDFEDHEGLVVEAFFALLEFCNFGQDGVGNFGCGLLLVLFNDRFEAVVAEHFAVVVLGIGYAVAEEEDGVAGLGGEGEFLVLDAGEEAEREAFGLDGFDFAAAADERLGGSGV